MTFTTRRWLGLCVFLLTLGARAQQYTISTYAGGAPPPTPTAATQASIGMPSGIATDMASNVYFSSHNCVFELDTHGTLTQIAGNSRAGFSGDGGPATSAQLNSPNGLAIDPNGNVYIADSVNQRIRMVTPTGTITTVAGDGAQGSSGDGGPAIDAQLNGPYGVVIDSKGNLFIGESGGIRKVAWGVITTFQHSRGYFLGFGTSLAIDSSDNLYVAEPSAVLKISRERSIEFVAGSDVGTGYSGDGGPAISASIQNTESIAVDLAGNIYLSQDCNIRKISTAGIITTIAGNRSPGFAGDGGPANAAQFYFPMGLAADPTGNLYIADQLNFRIRRISLEGSIDTVAGDGIEDFSGDGGKATRAQFAAPVFPALDANGNLYVADLGNNVVRKLSPSGIVTTVAGTGKRGYSGDGGPATSAQLGAPSSVAVDGKGNLYIADLDNDRIRKVSSTTGIITTVAGNGTPGYSGDGGQATAAQFYYPSSIALDDSGNLFIADQVSSVIRQVSPLGLISTAVTGAGALPNSSGGSPGINSQICFPVGLAADLSGSVYMSSGSTIQKLSAGNLTTVTTGPCSPSSPFEIPESPVPGIAVDANGNLYNTDSYNNLVQKIVQGTTTTIAGGRPAGYSGDGGSALDAQLYAPEGLAVDASGKIYVADAGNNAIRLLTPANSPVCIYSLVSDAFASPSPEPSYPTLNSSSMGGTYTVNITAAPGCGWAVVDLPDWIAVGNSSVGTGPGAVTLAIPPNAGVARAALVSVAGIGVTVAQSAGSGAPLRPRPKRSAELERSLFPHPTGLGPIAAGDGAVDLIDVRIDMQSGGELWLPQCPATRRPPISV